jgi:hypothetical protein
LPGSPTIRAARAGTWPQDAWNAAVGALQGSDSDLAQTTIGRLTAHLVTLRRLSRGVAALLEAREDASIHAAIVNDLGATFKRDLPEIARTWSMPSPTGNRPATCSPCWLTR